MKNSFAKKFDKVSSWSRGAAVGSVLAALCLGAFVGCDDDESGFATRPDGTESSSSSSVTLNPSTSSGQALESNGSSETHASSSSSSNSSSSGPAAGTLTYGGQTYRTVVIGAQTWMAENLNYEYKVNGSTYGNWCYNDSALYCERYGRLYTWAAAMDSATTGCGYGATCETDAGAVQGICPDGWHLPSRAEWDTLIAFVGGKDVAGRRLRSISGWYDNANGDDGYGFSALPSGIRHGNGGFDNVGQNTNFWSSSESSPDSSSQMYMYYTVRSAGPVDNAKNMAFSVRCVKDSK